MEAGTSGFVSISDSDRRVPAELGQEGQASSCLRKGTPLASLVVYPLSLLLQTGDLAVGEIKSEIGPEKLQNQRQ